MTTLLRFLCFVTLGLYLTFAAVLATHQQGGLDPAGTPVGYDFSAYYEAAKFAASGRAENAYDDGAMIAAERARFPGTKIRLPWNYPPLFQLFLLPFSVLPYFAAWLSWGGLLFAGYWAFLKKSGSGVCFWPLLLFPGAIINLFLGANGLLSALFLGAGLLALTQRPLIAGILLGCALYKPHLALLIPLALLAGRHYRALGAMALSAITLFSASALLFGLESWSAFLDKAQHMGDVAYSSSSHWNAVPTVYVLMQVLGLTENTAFLIHAAVAAASTFTVIKIWRYTDDLAFKAGALGTALLLVTPYARIYDLALLVFPLIALLRVQAARFSSSRRLLIGFSWLAPLAALFFGPLLPFLPILHIMLLGAMLKQTRGRGAQPAAQKETAPLAV